MNIIIYTTLLILFGFNFNISASDELPPPIVFQNQAPSHNACFGALKSVGDTGFDDPFDSEDTLVRWEEFEGKLALYVYSVSKFHQNLLSIWVKRKDGSYDVREYSPPQVSGGKPRLRKLSVKKNRPKTNKEVVKEVRESLPQHVKDKMASDKAERERQNNERAAKLIYERQLDSIDKHFGVTRDDVKKASEITKDDMLAVSYAIVQSPLCTFHVKRFTDLMKMGKEETRTLLFSTKGYDETIDTEEGQNFAYTVGSIADLRKSGYKKEADEAAERILGQVFP